MRRPLFAAAGGMALSLWCAAGGTTPAVTAQTPEAATALREQGKAVYETWCLVCHGDGRFMPGTAGLRAKYQGDRPAVLDDRTDLTPEFVRSFVRNGVGIMAPFRETEITNEELAALVAYLIRDRSPQ